MIIGYTTGVFDLFHVGHLNILKKSKLLCEYLIVGVSTDELVYEYKGKYPVIPFNDRLEIVKSIKYVDKVLPQIDRNKINAFKEIKFNKMFVGSDWKGNELFINTEEELKKYGVEIIYFDYTKKISSTIIRELINK